MGKVLVSIILYLLIVDTVLVHNRSRQRYRTISFREFFQFVFVFYDFQMYILALNSGFSNTFQHWSPSVNMPVRMSPILECIQKRTLFSPTFGMIAFRMLSLSVSLARYPIVCYILMPCRRPAPAQITTVKHSRALFLSILYGSVVSYFSVCMRMRLICARAKCFVVVVYSVANIG